MIFFLSPYGPWDWHIYLHGWLIFNGFHVGEYTIHYMDPMGSANYFGKWQLAGLMQFCLGMAENINKIVLDSKLLPVGNASIVLPTQRLVVETFVIIR